MKKLIIIIAGGMFAFGVAGAAPGSQSTPSPTPAAAAAGIITTDISGSDLTFFTGSARAAALITQLSGLAKTRAVTPQVQIVAAAIAKEQADACAALEVIAVREHIRLPREPDAAVRKQLEALGKLHGAKFDKSYLEALGEAQDSLEGGLTAGASSTNKDIKACAEAGLATLKQERDRVAKLGL